MIMSQTDNSSNKDLVILQVELGLRGYPITIGRGLLSQADKLTDHVVGRQVLIVTNETVAPLYLGRVKQSLSGFNVDEVILPDGEAHKNLATLTRLFDTLLEKKHNRTTTLVALGGGVVGDITGFAAAAYQRGVAFIQLPTTLLAQVDSSVGGKTGVNHPLGKNMIGAFYQPRAVIIDTESLLTLPDRELSAGIAEVIKYGLIADSELFNWLEKNIDSLLARDLDALRYVIHRSCRIKADVVAQDEKESGLRAILNLGHTFGHAIETGLGYGQWLHGEAVGAGMVMACDLSVRQGWLDSADAARAKHLIARAKLPVLSPESMTCADYLAHMSLDKKVVDGQIRLVLLERLGKAVITGDVPHEQIKATLIDCGASVD